MTKQANVALVVGAQGVIGRNLIDHLSTLEDWQVIGLSRRGGTDAGRVQHIAVDLLDIEDTRKKLGALSQVTHVFYAAYQDRPSWAELVPPNLAMLVNVVDTLEPVARQLLHISLMQATRFTAVTSDRSRRPRVKPMRPSCRRNSCTISSVFWNGASKARRGAGRRFVLRWWVDSPWATR